jgi:hypothetical protein
MTCLRVHRGIDSIFALQSEQDGAINDAGLAPADRDCSPKLTWPYDIAALEWLSRR